MKDYSYTELKNYIIEDFTEFVNQWEYNLDQTCARIIDEYYHAINSSRSQKVVIYTVMAILSKNKGTIPEIVRKEIENIKKEFSRKIYSDMNDNDFIMFDSDFKQLSL